METIEKLEKIISDGATNIFHLNYNLYLNIMFNENTVSRVIAEILLMELEFHKGLINQKKCRLYLNTGGGDMTQVARLIWAINNIISIRFDPVIVNGRCDSAGVYFLCAFPIRHCTKASTFYFHQGSVSWDNAATKVEMDSLAKRLSFEDNLYYDLVSKTTGMTKKKIMSLEKNEVYLTSYDAQKLGLINEIL